MKRRSVVVGAAAAVMLALGLGAVIVATVRLQRRRALRLVQVPPPPARPDATLEHLPLSAWSQRLLKLENAGLWEQLARELDAVEKKHPQLYRRYEMSYLHARVLIEADELEAAAARLDSLTRAGHPLQDLALYHRSTVADEEGDEELASRLRQQLIFGHPRASRRSDAIDDELAWLTSEGDAKRILTFVTRLHPSASSELRRRLEAVRLDALWKTGQQQESMQRAVRLLRADTGDDSAEAAMRLLDQPAILGRLTAAERLLVADAARQHRHFDRAIELYRPLRDLDPRKRDEIVFAIGRSHFGAERFKEAEQTYIAGAQTARDPKQKAMFFNHAARAVQLQGHDMRAEQLMTYAIAVPGRFDSTAAALTQRLRTRARGKRLTAAVSDYQQIRRLFPRRQPVVDAALALATFQLAAGRDQSVLATLDGIPAGLLDDHERAEVRYWKARALERRELERAVELYLEVLRSRVSSHFAYFARQRLALPQLSRFVSSQTAARNLEVDAALRDRKFDLARRLQTEIVLLSPADPGALAKLAAIYRNVPEYASILNLTPEPFPSLDMLGEVKPETRSELLLALGLFDEASDEIASRYSLGSRRGALTQSVAFNLGNHSRDSIRAIEVLMKSVPDDFVPQLLPLIVRELLYPRYYFDVIQSNADRYDADPQLVLAIMREESRFDPRAKSAAAARGLLQFIITTAHQIGRDLGLVDVSSEDLYDPGTIIQLGAKYIGDLLGQFGANSYYAAAAYNAGPPQVRLWQRLAPAAGNDYFLTAINFDETKHYVRKVMNSYYRYGEIYGKAAPPGGTRAEP